MDGVEIIPYEIREKGSDNAIEAGICISDGSDKIQIPTFKDETIEILK